MPRDADAGFRYEDLARFVAGLIERGTLPPGARLPSLREVSRQHRASLSTAMQAYRLLEDRGLIEARPQSGFYVRPPARRIAAPPASAPPSRPVEVAVPAVMLTLIEHASDPALVPLGCAVPSPALLASGALDRCLARAARTRGEALNTYMPPRGDATLRSEIARRALRHGHALTVDELLVTCGCTEALQLALRALTRPGQTVAVESPTYFGLLQVLQSLGLRVVELPTDARSGVDVDALEEACARHHLAACVLASSFLNPLGCTMSEAAKRRVLKVLARHRVPLVEDDIYGDLAFSDVRPRPFVALDPRAAVVYCSSFSKTLAPGYRVGWLAAGERLMPRLVEAKVASTLCSPALPQVALASYLASGGYDHHLRRLRRAFGHTLQQMVQAVTQSFPEGTTVSDPAGGFVLWVELPRPADTRQLFALALERGICFAPGVVFSASGRYGRCLRLSGGYGWSQRLDEGIRTLGRLATEAIGA
ncbi:PLP-dependent aminotransferase family protein [Ideonella sp. DXS29W]|uniref:PLP-dependent aminotransferase family protein n=1 Tax=Ideonella lacteola TaxID=2984193 RepID=A0ABU9BRE7_9BURK